MLYLIGIKNIINSIIDKIVVLFVINSGWPKNKRKFIQYIFFI